MAKAKKKSLVDSFVFYKAKEEVDKITKKEHHRNTIGTVKEYHDDVTIASLEHHRNSIGTISKRNTTGTPFIGLPKQQLKIYKWFLNRGEEGVFNRPSIMRETGIAYMTIRKALWKFEELGIIGLNYDKSLKEFEYKINLNIKIKEPKRNTIGTGTEQEQNTNISSSSYINKATTIDHIKRTIQEHHELGYWRQKGLTGEQVNHWIEVTGCSFENIIQYLCYCGFEMVESGLEEARPIKNVFNWFFRILEKTGHYPKPKDYKSCREKQIEQEQKIVEQKEQETKQTEELYRRKIETKQSKAFWDMMNDQEAKSYKKCFKSLNSFLKQRNYGKSFEVGMRKAFDKLILSIEE